MREQDSSDRCQHCSCLDENVKELAKALRASPDGEALTIISKAELTALRLVEENALSFVGWTRSSGWRTYEHASEDDARELGEALDAVMAARNAVASTPDEHHPECAWAPGNDECCSCAGLGSLSVDTMGQGKASTSCLGDTKNDN